MLISLNYGSAQMLQFNYQGEGRIEILLLTITPGLQEYLGWDKISNVAVACWILVTESLQ